MEQAVGTFFFANCLLHVYFQYFQSSEGNVAVVEFLMKQGAGIHMRDRNNDTPLLCAIKSGHNGFKFFLEEYFNFQMISISRYMYFHFTFNDF